MKPGAFKPGVKLAPPYHDAADAERGLDDGRREVAPRLCLRHLLDLHHPLLEGEAGDGGGARRLQLLLDVGVQVDI